MVKNHVAVTEKFLMVLSATGVGTSMCVLFTSVATAIATALLDINCLLTRLDS